MNLPLTHFIATHITTSDDVSELSDACLYSDHKARKQFDHIYSELRKDVEQLMKFKAVSQLGKRCLQDFLDGIDSAYSDACISMWADRINEAYDERRR